MTDTPKPVFLDHSGKRWRLIVRLAVGAALMFSLIGALLSFSIMVLPVSPLAMGIKRFIPKLETRAQAARRFVAAMERDRLKSSIADESRGKRVRRARSSGKPYSTVVGFYVNWDENSFDSFRSHVDSLTHVMPEWLALNPDGKSFPHSRWDATTDDPKMEELAHKYDVPIVVMLDNIDKGVFVWPRLRKLLTLDSDAQRALAEDLRDYFLSHHWSGINLDLEANYDGLSSVELQQAQKLIHTGRKGTRPK